MLLNTALTASLCYIFNILSFHCHSQSGQIKLILIQITDSIPVLMLADCVSCWFACLLRLCIEVNAKCFEKVFLF